MGGGYDEGPAGGMTSGWALWACEQGENGKYDRKILMATGHYYWERGHGAFHAELLAMHLGVGQLKHWLQLHGGGSKKPRSTACFHINGY